MVSLGSMQGPGRLWWCSEPQQAGAERRAAALHKQLSLPFAVPSPCTSFPGQQHHCAEVRTRLMICSAASPPKPFTVSSRLSTVMPCRGGRRAVRRLQQGGVEGAAAGPPALHLTPLPSISNRQPLPASCPLSRMQHAGAASPAAQLPANSPTHNSCRLPRGPYSGHQEQSGWCLTGKGISASSLATPSSLGRKMVRSAGTPPGSSPMSAIVVRWGVRV